MVVSLHLVKLRGAREKYFSQANGTGDELQEMSF